MSWVKLDDNFPDHPKLVRVPDSAFRLWVSAIAYCNRHLTDGLVPTEALRSISPVTRYPLKAASALVRERLWHDSKSSPCDSPSCPFHLGIVSPPAPGADFVIHDYWDYQPKSAKAEELSKIRADAGRRGGQAKAKQVACDISNPVPTRPDPSRPEDLSLDEGSSDLIETTLAAEGAGFNKYGTLLGAGLQAIRNLLPIYRAEILDAMKTNGRSWVYAARVIESARTEKARGKGPKAQGPEPKGRGWEPYVPPEDDDL